MITAEEKIDRAKDNIFKKFPFFSVIVADWKIREDQFCPTMATDGPGLYYNRMFVDSLTQNETNDVILHEAGHIFLAHHLRFVNPDGTKRPAQEWNIAADLALNDHIIKNFDQSGKIRKASCFPGETPFQNFPRKKDAEFYDKMMPQDLRDLNKPMSIDDLLKEIDKMIKDAGGKGIGKGMVIPGIGGIRPHPSQDPNATEEEKEEAQKQWESQVAGGIMTARGCGNSPGFIEEVAKEFMVENSAIDWKNLLRRFLTKYSHTRYSYHKPNRRSSYRKDVIMPARLTREASDGCILVDTSGSMSVGEMNRALKEAEKILIAYPGSRVTLRQADTQLQKSEKIFQRWDFPMSVPPTWSGRGGTELAGPIAELSKMKKFQWLIVVSDMIWNYGETRDPGIPTFWLMTKDSTHTPPFGMAIPLNS
jgi:predicted metal-dependent peptidase